MKARSNSPTRYNTRRSRSPASSTASKRSPSVGGSICGESANSPFSFADFPKWQRRANGCSGRTTSGSTSSSAPISTGSFSATVNGNGSMPFPHVTLNEVPINAWSQLVYVKDAHGIPDLLRQRRPPSTPTATHRPPARSGRFATATRANRCVWRCRWAAESARRGSHSRALSADEIRQDFEAKKTRYKPALSAEPVALREMDAQPAAGLWTAAAAR